MSVLKMVVKRSPFYMDNQNKDCISFLIFMMIDMTSFVCCQLPFFWVNKNNRMIYLCMKNEGYGYKKNV